MKISFFRLKDVCVTTKSGIQLKNLILSNYDNRMKKSINMLAAALLDPTTMNTIPVSLYLQEIKIDKNVFLKNLVEEENFEEAIPLRTQLTETEPTSSSRVQMCIQKYASTNSNSNDSLANEIERYLKIVKGFGYALDWWKENEIHFPRLARIARKYLVIPATSAMSESMFSRMGLILTNRRSYLTPDKAEKLIFINCNLKTIT